MFEEIATATREQGGCTVDRNGHALHSGFCLGGVEPSMQVPVDQFDADTVRTAFRRFRNRETLGTWLDRRTGIVHIDAVEIWPDKESCLREAARRREIAIYDLEKGQEYRLAA